MLTSWSFASAAYLPAASKLRPVKKNGASWQKFMVLIIMCPKWTVSKLPIFWTPIPFIVQKDHGHEVKKSCRAPSKIPPTKIPGIPTFPGISEGNSRDFPRKKPSDFPRCGSPVVPPPAAAAPAAPGAPRGPHRCAATWPGRSRPGALGPLRTLT